MSGPWTDAALGSGSDLLHRRAGALTVDGCDVAALAEQFGTPLYVMSETALRRRARALRATFAAAWPDGEVVMMAAVKANFGVAIHRVLALEDWGSDLVGAGELEVAIRAGVDPERISLNGTGKDLATICRAVELGARITLDDTREIDLTRRAAEMVGRRAVVRVRVRPHLPLDYPSDVYGIPIGEAHGRYKPGIPWDDLVAARADLDVPELHLAGIMMHFGRHTTDVGVLGQVALHYATLIGNLAARWDGWTPETIDIGGGLPALADPFGRARGGEPAAPGAATPDEYAEAICRNLRHGLRGAGVDPAGRRLEVEPGRLLFGPCGIHLSRVLNVKRQRHPFPYTWVETDTSQAFLPDIVLENARYPVLVAQEPAGDPAAERVDVVGRSCTSDVLARDELLGPVGAGTLLAFEHTGAYQEAGATNFNALSRPATVLVCGGDAHLVRRAETIDDILARDRVPAHLTKEPHR